jgi:hypothetical protein
MQSLVSLQLLFDLISPLPAQMFMSPKKYVDGIKDELTYLVVVAKVTGLVMKANQPICGSFEVITSEPTIQPNWPPMTS